MNPHYATVQTMSTKTQSILNEIKSLSLEERREVCEEVLQLHERQRQWEEQQAKIHELQSRHAGRGLLNRLLEERAKERAHD